MVSLVTPIVSIIGTFFVQTILSGQLTASVEAGVERELNGAR